MMFLLLATFAVEIAPIQLDPAVDDLQKRAFQFFIDESHPKTGLTKDRASNSQPDAFRVASIASTGFALASYPIGVSHGWMSRRDALDRTRRTLRSINDLVEHKNGWLYHFVDWETGKREWSSEASTIDTAILLGGVVVARQYWKDPETVALCDRFVKRIDWKWAMTDGGAKPDETMFGHGWRPEEGFLKGRWSAQYSEEKLLYVLGLGNSNLPTEGWEKIGRSFHRYKDHEFITGGPLFIHQMAESFLDFRDQRDRLGIDYWVNTRNAALANRQYCIDNPKEFAGYGPNLWGLSACDTPDGYRACGAPGWIDDNGTITPTSAVAAIPYLPDLATAFVQEMRTKHPKAWGRYGFPNGYNQHRTWIGPDVIGIDLGMMLLAIENHRNGFIWKLTSADAAVRRGMERLGFRKTVESGVRRLKISP